MRNTREKGKIPITERPRILAKYAAGEKVAHIARDYGCTPAAIRYILNRSKKQSETVVDAAVTRGEETLHPAGRSPRLPLHRRDAPSASGRYAFSSSGQDTFLDLELYARVTGDAVTFLAALDRTASEGSLASLEGLREAIERLMRSAARTSLEVGRLLDTGATARTAVGQSVFTGG
jgi:hypothetical protein